jgi:putative transposase
LEKIVVWRLYSDGGYIGTVGDDTLFDLIKKYIENQNTYEKKNHTSK